MPIILLHLSHSLTAKANLIMPAFTSRPLARGMSSITKKSNHQVRERYNLKLKFSEIRPVT